MKVYVCYSHPFGGYHITDTACPTRTNSGCQCNDEDHDVLYVFENDERAKCRLGLPDFLEDCQQVMEWTTPLKAIREKE